MDSTDKANFPDTVTYTIKVMHLTFKYALNSVHVTTGTVILMRLHKKPDLLEPKVNCTEDRKVLEDEDKL